MTLRERFQLATAVRSRRAAERAWALRTALERDNCLKRAAWTVGLPYGTAKRYRREWL